MFSPKCPGQDTRYWKNEDIYESPCPDCGNLIEFWKTDIRVRCSECKKKVINTRFNLGCAEWCSYAEQCLGPAAKGLNPFPYKKVLKQKVKELSAGVPALYESINEVLDSIEVVSGGEKLDLLPVLIATSIILLKKQNVIENENDILENLVGGCEFPEEVIGETASIIKNIKEGDLSGINERVVADQSNKVIAKHQH